MFVGIRSMNFMMSSVFSSWSSMMIQWRFSTCISVYINLVMSAFWVNLAYVGVIR